MSDTSQGPGWWQAADGKWYAPDQPPAPGWWKASDGNWYAPANGTPAGTGPAAALPAEAPPTAPVSAAMPVSPAGPNAGGVEPAPYAPTVTATPAKKRGKGPIVAGVLVVALLLIAVIAVVVVKGNGNSTTTTGSPTTSAGSGSNGNNGDPDNTTTSSGGSNNNGGSSDSTTPSGPDVEPDRSITLTADVVVVRSDGGKAVKASAPDGSTITIDGNAPGADKLAAGKILLLTGVTVARIKSIEKSGSDITMTITPATLPEVIADGELKWENQDVDPSTARLRLTGDDGYAAGKDGDGGAGSGGSGGGGGGGGGPTGTGDGTGDSGGDVSIPDGGDLQISAPRPGFVEGEGAAPATASVKGETVSGKAKDFSFEITHEATGGSGHHLHLKLASKGEVAGTIDVDVKLASFASSGNALVKDQQVKQFDFSMGNLGGTASVEANLQGLQNVAKIQMPPFFKLPFSLQFPFPVGGIPFTLSISGTVQVTVSMALANSTLSGKAEIEFGGDAGFHFKGGSASLDGKRTQDAKDLMSFLKAVAPGPVGTVITTELPKIGLGFGLKQIFAGVYLSNGTVVSLDSLPAPVSCIESNVAYVLAAGVEATFLGKEFDIARKPVVDKRWQFTVPKTEKCKGNK